jgi:hypothetical protein
VLILTSHGWEHVDGPLTRERILDWMHLSRIATELIDEARRVLPDSLDPDQHDHLLAPFGFDRATRALRISEDAATANRRCAADAQP